MCIKAGEDELDTVKNLMSMALKAVIAQALDADLDKVVPEARLVKDLRMGKKRRAALAELIADTFDGLEVDLNRIETVDELLDVVVMAEFQDVSA